MILKVDFEDQKHFITFYDTLKNKIYLLTQIFGNYNIKYEIMNK